MSHGVPWCCWVRRNTYGIMTSECGSTCALTTISDGAKELHRKTDENVFADVLDVHLCSHCVSETRCRVYQCGVDVQYMIIWPLIIPLTARQCVWSVYLHMRVCVCLCVSKLKERSARKLER